jgi:peptidoglycan/xylan/chitin deacetylase (PgdA/CDA1 family)
LINQLRHTATCSWGAIIGAIAASAWLVTVRPDVAGGLAQNALVPRSLALTFDDLPYVDVGEAQLSKAQRATRELLRVLASHGAPVVGFVNEAKLGSGPELTARTALLQRWVDAGAVLGNHTYAHADLNTFTIQQFEDDVVRGEIVTRRLMQSHQPYQLYFRHPQTHTGDTQAKKEAIERFLEAKGYRIAPHTIDSSDFVFNAALAHARNGDDAALVTRLRTAYLNFVISATEFAERISLQIFGRDIPQTIVLHANDINAECLDELLQRLERRGYHFVTLDNATADPTYRTRDALVTKSGPTWLWRWMKSQGKSVSFKEDPEPPEWVMELFAAATR